jgi:hypothetical protein
LRCSQKTATAENLSQATVSQRVDRWGDYFLVSYFFIQSPSASSKNDQRNQRSAAVEVAEQAVK